MFSEGIPALTPLRKYRVSTPDGRPVRGMASVDIPWLAAAAQPHVQSLPQKPLTFI